MGRTLPRVVVTGGIGSGKSSVCALLSNMGVAVIDADRLGHEVLEPDGEAFGQVAERWPQVVSRDKIHRARLGEIVFSDPSQLAELMEITHPHIRARLHAEVGRHPGQAVAVEISAPSDEVMPPWPVLVVDSDPQIVHRRLLGRGMSETEIARRRGSQRSRREWLDMADVVVRNDVGREALAREVTQVAERLGLLSL